MSEVTVNVKASNDQKYVISLQTTDTVLDFKNKIAEKCDTPADRMRLIYSGRVLKDQDTIESYKIAEGHTVHMVRSAVPAAAGSAAPAAATSPAAAATPAAAAAPTTPASTAATTTPAAAAGKTKHSVCSLFAPLLSL
jgi:ubiquilin